MHWQRPLLLSTHALMRLHHRDIVHGTLPQALLGVLADHVQARGLNARQLIDADLWPLDADPVARMPAERFCRLLMKAALRLQDEHFGLQLGQSIQVQQLGPLGYLLQTSACLGDALLQVQRYHRLLHDLNPIEATLTADTFTLRWGVAHGRPGPLFDEAGVAGIVTLGRRLCQQPPRLLAVDFVNPRPRDPRLHQAFFQCPVRWAQPETRLVLPMVELQLPLRQPDPRLHALMSHQLAPALATLHRGADLKAPTQRLIVQLARQGRPTLAAVASALRLHPRQYERQLAAQGLHFRALRHEALAEQARQLLADPERPVAVVARELGYTEPSAFTRAFSAWTGHGPQQWRLQHASRPPKA